jgi:hypothetical protein
LHGTLAVSVSGSFINCGPTFVASKPVLLLVRQLLQHELGFAAIAALEAAKFILVQHCLL